MTEFWIVISFVTAPAVLFVAWYAAKVWGDV